MINPDCGPGVPGVPGVNLPTFYTEGPSVTTTNPTEPVLDVRSTH